MFFPPNVEPPVPVSTEPKMDLSLVLETPPGERAQQLKERTIEDLPRPVAEKIMQDFVSHGPESETERYQMCRVGEGPGERLIALDLGEWIAWGMIVVDRLCDANQGLKKTTSPQAA
jgi:hypothetical protein